MCKYCKVRCDRQTDEVLNDVKVITRVRNGWHSIELALNRYKIDKTAESGTNEFLLREVVYFKGRYRKILKEVNIDIKYCPFCGEKL